MACACGQTDEVRCRGRAARVVHEHEDRLFCRKGDPLAQHVDQLSDSHVHRDEVLRPATKERGGGVSRAVTRAHAEERARTCPRLARLSWASSRRSRAHGHCTSRGRARTRRCAARRRVHACARSSCAASCAGSARRRPGFIRPAGGCPSKHTAPSSSSIRAFRN